MPFPTVDPDIEIIETIQEPHSVLYRSLSTGAEWRVDGVCNRCGLCVIGAVDPEHPSRWVWSGVPGQPFAVEDTLVGSRLDEPVTVQFIEDMAQMLAAQPESSELVGCSLTAEATDG